MIKVKNVRAGIVIIADAGLKLAPGETVPLDRLTGQMQKAVDAGLLARIDSDDKAKPKSAPKVEETKQELTKSETLALVEDNSLLPIESSEMEKINSESVESTPGVKRGGK